MKGSTYNHFVAAEDAVYAVNLLSRAAMELSHESYAAYCALARGESPEPGDEALESFISVLKQNLFLLEDDFDELAHIQYRTQQERFDRGQLGLVIAPTLGCNFNCHYCFEDKRATTLSDINQARLIELVQQQLPGRKDLSVQWFGGEPLAAMPVVDRLSCAFMQIARAAHAGYSATVITNGFLMTEAVSRLLADRGVQLVQITLDGDRHQHDRTRFERRGEGSFDVILDNIRAASHLFAVKVRVHVAPYNLRSVHKLLETLAHEEMQRHISEIYFAPLFNYRQSMKAPAYATDDKRFMSSSDFAAAQVSLLERALGLNFRIPDFLDVSYGICTAVRDSTLVVDANGALVKCYKDVGVAPESIGTLGSGIIANANLQKWMATEVPRDAECKGCRFLPVCLGGCSKQWHENASKDVICTPLKFNAADMIRLHFAGGQWAGREAR